MNRKHHYFLYIASLNIVFAALYILLSFSSISDNFLPLDLTSNIKADQREAVFTLTEKEPYHLKIKIEDPPASTSPVITFNNMELQAIRTRKRNNDIITKYYIPENYIEKGKNKVGVLWRGNKKYPGVSVSATIKNFRARPFNGMYVLSDQSSFFKKQPNTIKSLLVSAFSGLTLLFLIFLSLRIIKFYTPMSRGLTFSINLLSVLPFITIFIIIWSIDLFTQYRIVISSNFYLFPYLSLYLICAYPSWVTMKKRGIFKLSMVFFFYLILGTMFFLMLGFDDIAGFFANISFIVLIIAVIFAVIKCISKGEKNAID